MNLIVRTSPPRWAVLAAHVIPLLVLPSTLWRIALVLGFTGGYTEAGLAELDLDGAGRAYVLGLSVMSEAVALLSLGLVRGWGEKLPARLVVASGSFGALILAVLWTPLLLWWNLPHDDMTESGAFVVGLLYLPMVAWVPLLAALTVSYRRRRLGRA